MAKRKVLEIKKEVPATWEEALQEFLFWKQGQGLAERTLADYQRQTKSVRTHAPTLPFALLFFYNGFEKSGSFLIGFISLAILSGCFLSSSRIYT